MELGPSVADFQEWVHTPEARLCQPFEEGTGLMSGGLTFSIRHMIQKYRSGVAVMRKCAGKNSANTVLWMVAMLPSQLHDGDSTFGNWIFGNKRLCPFYFSVLIIIEKKSLFFQNRNIWLESNSKEICSLSWTCTLNLGTDAELGRAKVYPGWVSVHPRKTGTF